jgi:hypothetical protein
MGMESEGEGNHGFGGSELPEFLGICNDLALALTRGYLLSEMRPLRGLKLS